MRIYHPELLETHPLTDELLTSHLARLIHDTVKTLVTESEAVSFDSVSRRAGISREGLDVLDHDHWSPDVRADRAWLVELAQRRRLALIGGAATQYAQDFSRDVHESAARLHVALNEVLP